ncbi:hypothetical protein QTP70_017508, partial [Hemibagrus guttatus]
MHIRTRRMIQDKTTSVPEYVLSSLPGPEKLHMEWSLPAFINMFLPEFPHCSIPGHEHFQILGYIAKGSFGPILKVKDKSKQKTYAVKVIPKSEILRLGVLDQSKEEVIVQAFADSAVLSRCCLTVALQRQVRHPFIHDLQDCWQTQHHLYIMCDYCSTGDLYTYWVMTGQFGEDVLKVFAAELGSAIGFLHDYGIIHRDVKVRFYFLVLRRSNDGSETCFFVKCGILVVKMENVLLSDQGHLRLADFGLSRRLEYGGRAFTICGTIQYMAPEVLSGGPYSHAADWWSLGILLFALATGKVESQSRSLTRDCITFPVPPESDHCCMLKKVRCFPYDMPRSFSPPFALLLTELLCKTPTRRLRTLERFKRQTFFHGTPFDSQLLQKSPVELILELKKRPDRPAKACRGVALEPFPDFDFDCSFHGDSTSTSAQETLEL